METIADVDCLVVGSGVIGLAITRALSLAGLETLLVEQDARPGTQISSRNSGVIHSGVYYPPNSLKARFCRTGRDALYAYAAAKNLPHRRCGKLIVATSDAETETLGALHRRALENGVEDLVWLSRGELLALEPDIAGVAALLSPSTGIIDAVALIDALATDAADAGATLAFNSRFVTACRHEGHIISRIDSNGETGVKSRWLVNAGGLAAPDIAGAIDGVRTASLPRAHYARGSYFIYSKPTRFRHLVYPIPEPGGLGIHLTLDMDGQARFGPDVEWIDHIDYRVDERRKPDFLRAIQRYWPSISAERLQPGYSGIRPKIVPEGTRDADFLIQTEADHGLAGLINLMGIESPGLTASLAIADHVRSHIGG